MQDRSYYERMFTGFPELVATKELREMLGGVCENTALKILRAKQIQHYRIRGAYMIPKECVIDYMLTEEYEKLRRPWRLHGGSPVRTVLRKYRRRS